MRAFAPWSHEQAISFLREGTSTLFDSRCVEALARVLAREETLAVAS